VPSPLRSAVPHREVDGLVAPGPGIEARARRQRRVAADALRAGRAVATGHTRDDRVETILYRLAASPGAAAFAALPAADGDGRVRPLLELGREEVRDGCGARASPGATIPRTATAHSRATACASISLPPFRSLHPAAEANLPSPGSWGRRARSSGEWFGWRPPARIDVHQCTNWIVPPPLDISLADSARVRRVDFSFDQDQELLRSTTRRFLAERHPLAALRPVLEAPEVLDRDHWREGAEIGWTAMLVPAQHGGGAITAQPLVDLVAVAEELGRVLHPGPLVPTNVVADALARFASGPLRNELLPGIASGELLAAWALTADGSADPSSSASPPRRTAPTCGSTASSSFVEGATDRRRRACWRRPSCCRRRARCVAPLPSAGGEVRRLEGST